MTTQPELPIHFGRRPDELVATVTGKPYRSSVAAFTPDTEVVLIVRCRVGETRYAKQADGRSLMYQTLNAVEGYPVDFDWGAAKIEQHAASHEKLEDAERRKREADEGRTPIFPDDLPPEAEGDTTP